MIKCIDASRESVAFKAIRQYFEKPSSREIVYIYGNWCGVERGGCITDYIEDCNTRLSCIDQIDCACKRHDICLTTHGYNNCKCDQELFNSVKNISRLNARIVAAAIALNPCERPVMFQYPCNCEVNDGDANCQQCNGCQMRRTWRRRRDITYKYYTCEDMLRATRQRTRRQTRNTRSKNNKPWSRKNKPWSRKNKFWFRRKNAQPKK